MTEQEKRKGGGSKLSRSQTVTVRLVPKVRYLAELAARKQRRTLSSFVEWAIEESLHRIFLYESADFNGQYNRTVGSESETLWDVDEADRFAKLALHYTEMLTYEEQVLWKLVRENGYLWRGKYVGSKWSWTVEEESFLFDRLREHWEDFNAVVSGKADASVLPTWAKEKTEPKPAPDSDDDIPF